MDGRGCLCPRSAAPAPAGRLPCCHGTLPMRARVNWGWLVLPVPLVPLPLLPTDPARSPCRCTNPRRLARLHCPLSSCRRPHRSWCRSRLCLPILLASEVHAHHGSRRRRTEALDPLDFARSSHPQYIANICLNRWIDPYAHGKKNIGQDG